MATKLERLPVGGVEFFKQAKNSADSKALGRIEGYAAKYNVYSELLWGCIYTLVLPGFFDGVLNAPDIDVKCNIDHDNDDILARYYPAKGANSLELSLDDVGLKFGFDVPDTTLGRDTAENVRVGNILGCSMCVEVDEDDWQGTYKGAEVRKLVKCARLLDVCLTTDPAFTDTEVSAFSSKFMSKSDYLALAKSKRKDDGLPTDYYVNKFKLLS